MLHKPQCFSFTSVPALLRCQAQAEHGEAPLSLTAFVKSIYVYYALRLYGLTTDTEISVQAENY